MSYRWTRQTYSGRGKLQGRDPILEKITSNACIICGKTLERKRNILNGKLEAYCNFIKRKTCGRYQNKLGQWKWTDCVKEWRSGEGNPNYKGYMPKCEDCGKSVTIRFELSI